MKNMNYTSDVEYETETEKKFQITRGMVLLASAILIAIIVIVIIILSSNRKDKPEYTIEDFNSLENRMIDEAPNYVLQKQIVLTEEEIKIDLQDLLLENGGAIDSKVQTAAKICDGYVLASKDKVEKYFSFIKCGDLFETYGYENSHKDIVTTTKKTVVKDNTKPDILLIGEKEISIKVGEKYNEQGASATDNVDGDITSEIKITGNVNINVPGKYTLVYSVSDAAGNKNETTRIISVLSKATTTMRTTTTTNSSTNSSRITTARPTTARRTTSTTKATTRRTTTSTSRTTTTTARPTIPPIITLYGNRVINLKVGGSYNEPGYSAVDSTGKDITGNVNVSGNVNITKTGTYYVTYSVYDTYGNFASATRTVNVKQETIVISGISITPNRATISVGDTKTLVVGFTPSNASNKAIAWSSSNIAVATVKDGIVHGRSKGSVTITAKTINGKTATAIITVR